MAEPAAPPGPHSPVARGQVVLFIAVRMVMNGAYRMVYPFLDAFASGMGVSLQVAALPLTARSLIGVLSPLSGPIADRYGRKLVMLMGLGLFLLGVGTVAVWPSFSGFFIALVLAGFGNQIFVPAMQAYLGDRVIYQRRGAVLAMTELGWSLSFILLVPLLGLLIARLGWVGPFWLLTGLGLAGFLLVSLVIPYDPPHPSAREYALLDGFRRVAASRNARMALTFSLMIILGNEVINVTFGVWLRGAFQLQVAALGLAALVIGMAELAGESATALLVDRIGKKRAVRGGVIFTCLAAVALPWLGSTQWGAIAGLFLFYLGFEFTLVSYIPLMTEALPEARGTLLAVNLAANSLGRALGALIGPWLFSFGFGTNAWVALAIYGLALLVLRQIRVED